MAYHRQHMRPMTYADSPDGSLESREKNGITKYRCDCGRWVHGFVLIDVRSLPTEVTQGQSWACDACWTAWTRPDPKTQRTIRGRPLTRLEWLRLHGATAEVITAHTERIRRERTELQAERAREAARGAGGEIARLDDLINRIG